ncbi:MAG TPA: response regulator [Flavisolibacter sp.]
MKKILVIEDNIDILDNITEVLELSNYHVSRAENGRLGIEKAIETHPDLILCDIMMPEIDGYGVLHMVQHNPDLQSVPFIFLTAKTEPVDMRKGMALGADDYITKPFDATDLLNAIEIRLKKAEQLKQRMANMANGLREWTPGTGADKALADFVEGRHLDRYKKKQLIFSEGNHPVRLYHIRKGKVKIFKTNNEGKELIMRIVNEGDFFGYLAMMEETTYKANAEAIEESEIAAIPRHEFESLLYSNPEVSRRFIRLLARDVTEVEEQLIHLAYNSLRRKVADALLVVQKKFTRDNEPYNISISRENLAAIAGTATESLIRTLSDFKAEKLIDVRNGKIAILNEEKLVRMVN